MDGSLVEPTSRLSRARAWLTASLGFFVLLLVLVLMQRQVAPQIAFVADEAYVDVSAARTLLIHGRLGLDETSAMPATTDALWQFLLSLGLKVFPHPLSAPLALGALLGLLAILNTQTLARLFNAGAWSGTAAILLAVASSLPMDVLRGQSVTLSVALVVMLMIRYLEGAPRERWPLPLGAAWWAGWAALVHVELLVIWLPVALHALVTGSMRRGRGRGFIFPLFRILSSVVIVGMVLTPALAWNIHVLSVPWPRFPDAPLSLDAWAAQPPGEVFAASVNLATGVLGECYVRAFSVPVLRGGLPFLFMLIGLGYTVVDASRDRQRLTGSVGVALLFVPLFYALLYPYVGWNAASSVFAALQPVWAVLIALGVGRSAVSLCRVIGKLARREWGWLSPGWAAAVLMTIFTLMGALRQIDTGRSEFGKLAQVQADRARVTDALGAASSNEVLASDRIGWLAFTREGRYFDLTGRVSPLLLAFRTPTGWQGAEAAAYLRERGVNRIVTWDAAYAYAESVFGCPATDPLPRVCPAP